ncbi:hypothetical protein BACCELL_00964 [Bacteroides cellulosilyticus DSM 14838]|uniref:Uncharacterized protein n=1 Tax=Bacteroides cellulosilyticus DSM 14838 TaxID=537012 RepID=E2N9L8_9BACE|nr:hypothetical protein BACCELL_00964 [Bacteroides cellulosilyticus DSM 14838]
MQKQMNTHEARWRVLKSRFRDDFTKIEYDFHTSGKDSRLHLSLKYGNT